jgi:hypothetical protein
MPLNLRNIRQPPNRKTYKKNWRFNALAMLFPIDDLPTPRRADNTDDLPLYGPAQFADGQEIKNVVFDSR